MTENRTSEVVRSALFAMWGMATLVLLFALGLLVYEMLQRGQDPLELSFREQPVQTTAPVEAAPASLRNVNVYFANAGGTGLAQETRRIEIGSHTVENCRRVLETLIAGPLESSAPVLDPATKIRGIYLLDDGELVVDFSRDLESGLLKSFSAELFMVRGVVSSLAQAAIAGGDKPVRKVRFLFEGAPPHESFPLYVDLSRPVSPNKSWLPEPAPQASNG